MEFFGDSSIMEKRNKEEDEEKYNREIDGVNGLMLFIVKENLNKLEVDNEEE